MPKGDSDAVIVATIGEKGIAEHVWRYRGREFERAADKVVALTKQSKLVRVTFLDCANGGGLDDEQRARLEELAP